MLIDLDLEVEEEETKKGVEPPAYWPTKDGSVVVENLTCKYAPQVSDSRSSRCQELTHGQLEPVLKDVSFTIGPKEKIGICGRTGSGKSSRSHQEERSPDADRQRSRCRFSDSCTRKAGRYTSTALTSPS